MASLFCFRFRPVIVKECIHNVLNEHLDGKSYEAEEIMDWTKSISDDIKNKLKGKKKGFCSSFAFISLFVMNVGMQETLSEVKFGKTVSLISEKYPSFSYLQYNLNKRTT